MSNPSAPHPPILVLQQAMLRRALEARDSARLHLRFHARVVNRYKGLTGAKLMRTRTVGRISVTGRWSLDVGIAAGGLEVHLAARDLFERLPEKEWTHWVEHLVEAPASENFLIMGQSQGACIDDGEPEDWK